MKMKGVKLLLVVVLMSNVYLIECRKIHKHHRKHAHNRDNPPASYQIKNDDYDLNADYDKNRTNIGLEQFGAINKKRSPLAHIPVLSTPTSISTVPTPTASRPTKEMTTDEVTLTHTSTEQTTVHPTTYVATRLHTDGNSSFETLRDELDKIKLMLGATKIKADIQSLVDAALDANPNTKTTASSHSRLTTVHDHILTTIRQSKDGNIKKAASLVQSDIDAFLDILTDKDQVTTIHTTPFPGTTTIGTQTTPKPFPGEYQGFIPVTKAQQSIIPTTLVDQVTRNQTRIPPTAHAGIQAPHNTHETNHSKDKTQILHLQRLFKNSTNLIHPDNIAKKLSVINRNILTGMVTVQHTLRHLDVKLRRALRSIGDTTADNTNEERTDIKVNSDKIAQLQQGLEAKIDDLRYNITGLIKSQKQLADAMTWSMEKMMVILSKMVDKVIDTEEKEESYANTKPSTTTTVKDATVPSEDHTQNNVKSSEGFTALRHSRATLDTRNGDRINDNLQPAQHQNKYHSVLQTTSPIMSYLKKNISTYHQFYTLKSKHLSSQDKDVRGRNGNNNTNPSTVNGNPLSINTQHSDLKGKQLTDFGNRIVPPFVNQHSRHNKDWQTNTINSQHSFVNKRQSQTKPLSTGKRFPGSMPLQ